MRRSIVIASALAVVTSATGCVRVFAETAPQMTVRNRTGQGVVLEMQVDGRVVGSEPIPAGQTALTGLSVGPDGCSFNAFVVVAADGSRTAPRERPCNDDEWIITPSDLHSSPPPS